MVAKIIKRTNVGWYKMVAWRNIIKQINARWSKMVVQRNIIKRIYAGWSMRVAWRNIIKRIYAWQSKMIAWRNIIKIIYPEHQKLRYLESHGQICHLTRRDSDADIFLKQYFSPILTYAVMVGLEKPNAVVEMF